MPNAKDQRPAELADRLAVDLSPEGELMRRYQLDADRKLERALHGLVKLRRAAAAGVAGDPAPGGGSGAEQEPVGTVEPEGGPADGPGSEADPILDPGSGILDPSPSLPDSESPLPDSDVAEPARAEVAAPGGPAAQPEGGLVPQCEHDPTTPANAERTLRNEPGPLGGERAPRNELGPPVGGDPASQDEPAGPGPIAGLGVPALVCALLMLLAAGLSAAFAGPVAGPIGRPSMTPAARAGPDGRDGPFPRRRYRLDLAGLEVGKALRPSEAGIEGGKARIPSGPFVPLGMNPMTSPAETQEPIAVGGTGVRAVP